MFQLQRFFQNINNIIGRNEKTELELLEILKRKSLSPDLFSKQFIRFQDDISLHVKWAFQHIYRVPYLDPVLLEDHETIARYHHGIQHVTRVTLYIPVLANLYRRYGDAEAIALTEEDIKLLQIAAVFHDAAREDEAEDRWDHESGILLYCYLTKVLRVRKEKAKLIAEAMANKDHNEKGYFVINETKEGNITWRWESAPPQKNIYQKLIHDADCLDIIRARDAFDARYLECYKQFGTNALAFDEIAHLIMEIRSLIEIGGDSRNRTRTEIKAQFEHENAYQAIFNSINKDTHKIISTLSAALLSPEELKAMRLIDETVYDPNQTLTEENLKAAIREGKVFARGIATPSAISTNPLKSGEDESLAHLEIRKTKRRKGIPTTTFKSDRFEKEGNPLRSVSMVGYGSGVFTDAGFFIVNPNIDNVRQVNETDIGSGRRKKLVLKDKISKKPLTTPEKYEQISALHQKLKLGGSVVQFSGVNAANHNEIIYDISIRDYSAIYFCSDPNLYNDHAVGSFEVMHLSSPILQAVFLQNAYAELDVKKRQLPIFEYSWIHNTTRQVPEIALTGEYIQGLWVSMCTDYIQSCLNDPLDKKIYTRSIDDIKVLSMYKIKHNRYGAKVNAPADANYEETFRKKLTATIENEKEKLIEEHEQALLKKLNTREADFVFSDEIFFNLIRSPRLINNGVVQKKIKNAFHDAIQNNTWDLTKVDDFLKNSSESKEFYQCKTMRMYELAVFSGLAEEVEHLRQIMAKLIIEKIEEISSIISKNRKYAIESFYYNYDDLEKIINFSTSFGLYLDGNIVKEKQDNLIDRYFNVITEDYFERGIRLSQGYFSFISYLLSIKMLNDKQAQIVQTSIMNVVKLGVCDEMFDHRALTAFLSMHDQFFDCYPNGRGVHQQYKKEIVSSWMLSRVFWFSDFNFDVMKKIIEHFPNDIDIFILIVKHLPMNLNPILFGINEIDLRGWLEVASDLKSRMPDKQFNNKQFTILQESLNALCSQLILNISQETDNTEACKLLINNIYWLMASDMPFKLPEEIVLEANNRFQHFSTQSLLEYEKRFFEHVQTNLPVSQESASLIPLFG